MRLASSTLPGAAFASCVLAPCAGAATGIIRSHTRTSGFVSERDMAKQLLDTGVEPSAASHSAGGILVGMGDGSVRNAAPPQSPAGPVPVPYPNLEAAAGVSAKGDGGYVVTSASHAANDTTYQGDSIRGLRRIPVHDRRPLRAQRTSTDLSRFSTGTVDGGGGPHALYEDTRRSHRADQRRDVEHDPVRGSGAFPRSFLRHSGLARFPSPVWGVSGLTQIRGMAGVGATVWPPPATSSQAPGSQFPIHPKTSS